VREERVHGGPAAIDQIDHPGRQLELVEQLEDPAHGEGDLLGRLDDVGVAGGERVGGEPHGDHGGEVEGGDHCEDAEGLAHDLLIDPAGDVLEIGAHHQRWYAGGDLDVLDGPAHLSARLVERLPFLLHDRAGEVLEARLHQLLQAEEVLHPHGGRRLAPFVEALRCRGDGFVHLGARREGDPADHLVGGRVEDVERIL